MSKMLLVAIFAGATERTTPTVLAHRRRHLLSTGDIPSPSNRGAIVVAEQA